MKLRALAALAVFLCLGGCGRGPERAASPARRTDITLPPDTETIAATVARNATLDSIFREASLRTEVAIAAIEAVRGAFRPREFLRAQQPYRIVRTLDGSLRRFEYQIDVDRFLRVYCPDIAQPDRFDVQIVPYEKRTEIAAVHASIDADHPSLVAAIDAAGENVQLAISLAEIFGGDVDFQSDLQPGDTVELLFEKIYREGQFAGYGNVAAARLVNDGRDLQAYRFTRDGKTSYYDERGRSLRRFFLKSPLRFEPRITSRFSYRRLHPVYGGYRPHLGVDYGAPIGAPVQAVASGAVLSAGYSGGAGLMVHLRHSNGFESLYLHLSALGKGIRRGARVDQGQLVGRVGASGTATGPHLDYRLKRNGAYLNPLTVHRKLPPGEPIPASLHATFDAERALLMEQMSTTLRAGNTVPGAGRDAVKAAEPVPSSTPGR
jgi:murein DD-endopeptidase MepM/ murein hydrolase activator NlpD/predicted small secreted protein